MGTPEDTGVFRRILAYVSVEDENMIAAEQAASLARRYEARLSLLRVLRDPSVGVWTRSRDADEVRRAVEDEQRALLEARAHQWRQQGLDVRTDIRWGTPWLEVTYAVLRHGHDLVVKTAEGALRQRRWLFGSTALHLIRKCPAAIWVVGRTGGADARRVLAAVDPGDEPTRMALARRVLEVGLLMSGADGDLHAVSAWSAPHLHFLRSRAVPDEAVTRYVRDARDMAQEGLQRAVVAAGGPLWTGRVHLIQGEPEQVIPAFVTDHTIDLVVMGSVGRVGLEGFLIGETAETIVRSVQCSVLVVKPHGFISPVRAIDEAPEALRHSEARA
ncbi:MAG: universal stress protein [Vicinamibacterales bacterium]